MENAVKKKQTERVIKEHSLVCRLPELLRFYSVQRGPDRSIVKVLHNSKLDTLSDATKKKYAPMTQGDLATATGIRPSAISDLVNLRREGVNIFHLTAIANVLGIKDLGEIVNFK